MVWQRAGTVSVQAGSTTVTGTNVDFAAGSRNGDSFIGPDGLTYEVVNVASATVISILPAYKGPTLSGGAYAIMPVQGYDKMLSDAFNNLNNQFGPKLAALGTTGNYEILPLDKGGTGSTTPEGARTALALGTAATANVTKTAVSTVAGEITKVGDFGLGRLLALYPVADMNNYSAPTGHYYVTSAAANTPYPGAYWGLKLDKFADDGTCRQEVWDLNAPDALYFRGVDRGTPTAWRKFYHSGNTTRAADGTLKAI